MGKNLSRRHPEEQVKLKMISGLFTAPVGNTQRCDLAFHSYHWQQYTGLPSIDLASHKVSPAISLSQKASFINTFVINASSSSAAEAILGRRGKVNVNVTP